MLSMLTWMALACVARPAPERERAPEPEKTTEEAPVLSADRKTNPDLSLSWTLTRSGEALEVTYTLTNQGRQRVYVVDQLYTGGSGPRVAVPDRLIVAAASKPDTVLFARGIVEVVNTIVEFDAAPGAVHLDPGQQHQGSARVPLPLSAWHPYAPSDPLPERPRFATLEIATLSGVGEWGTVPLEGGGTLTVPQLGYYFREVAWVSGEAKPLP